MFKLNRSRSSKWLSEANRQIIQQRAEYKTEMAKIERTYESLDQGIEMGNADQKPSN